MDDEKKWAFEEIASEWDGSNSTDWELAKYFLFPAPGDDLKETALRNWINLVENGTEPPWLYTNYEDNKLEQIRAAIASGEPTVPFWGDIPPEEMDEDELPF